MSTSQTTQAHTLKSCNSTIVANMKTAAEIQYLGYGKCSGHRQHIDSGNYNTLVGSNRCRTKRIRYRNFHCSEQAGDKACS